MMQEEEQFFFSSVNNTADAFEYFGVEKILSYLVEKHPSYLEELKAYVDKQKEAIDIG